MLSRFWQVMSLPSSERIFSYLPEPQDGLRVLEEEIHKRQAVLYEKDKMKEITI
jgi:hypothetical protein